MNSFLSILDSKLFLSLLTTFSGLALTAFVWQRSKSSHSWLSKLWGRYRGKLDYEFPFLTRFFHQLDAIDHFRFITGIHADTIQSVEKAIKWSERRNIAPKKIAACGEFFDLSKGRVKTRKEMPHLGFALVAYTLSMALVLLSVFLLLGVITDRALLRFTESGTYFLLDERIAKPLGKAGITLADCAPPSKPQKELLGFTPEEVSLICAEVSTGRVPAFVQSTVRGQRIASGAALLPTLVLLRLFFVFTTTWGKATALRQEILKPRLQRRKRHNSNARRYNGQAYTRIQVWAFVWSAAEKGRGRTRRVRPQYSSNLPQPPDPVP